MLVMDWLFPVPGGPWRMKLLPLIAASMASSWDESAPIGSIISPGATAASRSSPVWTSLLTPLSTTPVKRLFTRGLLFITSALPWMSFHITNLLKEKFPSIAVSSRSQPLYSIMHRLMMLNTSQRSTPLLSFGSGLSPGISIWKNWRSISCRVMLNIVSSSRPLML